MLILDLEIVVADGEELESGLARKLAEAAGKILGAPAGKAWVKVRALPRGQYAENGEAPAGLLPVFVNVLKSQIGSPAERTAEAAKLSEAIAQAIGRAAENVHILYEPDASGRVAFGGELFVDKTAPAPQAAAAAKAAGTKANPRNLFVGGIAFKMTSAELERAFSACGPVAKLRLLTDKETGKSKGLAFVEMATEEGARAALAKLNGATLAGRKIFVSEAKPPEQRPAKKPYFKKPPFKKPYGKKRSFEPKRKRTAGDWGGRPLRTLND